MSAGEEFTGRKEMPLTHQGLIMQRISTSNIVLQCNTQEKQKMDKETWEQLEIGEDIGYGSFGQVYLASLNGKKYALKRIRVPDSREKHESHIYKMGDPEKAGEYCPEKILTLLEEVWILKKFRKHPNIVSVLDYRLQENAEGFELEILMEYLEPFTLYETTHAMSEKEVVSLGIDMCRALEVCEEEGILHRDIKIENILVAEDGTFKLCDFGSARILEEAFIENSVEGSFPFMAPEVYNGKKYDHRADIYSLGLILYRCLNHGREPFISIDKRMIGYKDREDAVNRRMNGEPLPAPADASEKLSKIILKACAYDPEERYRYAEDLRRDLARYLNVSKKKKKIEVRPPGWKGYQPAAVLVSLGILLLIEYRIMRK